VSSVRYLGPAWCPLTWAGLIDWQTIMSRLGSKLWSRP